MGGPSKVPSALSLYPIPLLTLLCVFGLAFFHFFISAYFLMYSFLNLTFFLMTWNLTKAGSFRPTPKE